MNKDLENLELLVTAFITLRNSDEEIIERLKKSYENSQLDFSEQEFKDIIEKTRASLADTPIEATDRAQKYEQEYEGELDETKYDNLVFDVTKLYAQDLNDYDVKKRLEYWGVDEKYHDEICKTAYEQVRRATQREGNLTILLGIGISIFGLFLLIIAFSSGLGKAYQILAIPFGYGVYTIYRGVVQKESM